MVAKMREYSVIENIIEDMVRVRGTNIEDVWLWNTREV
jgi:hypothetical protein